MGTASGTPVTSVRLLGSDAVIGFDQQADGLHLTLPAEPPGRFAYAFRIATGE
jgi:alpha-L-fucosidase